MAKRPVTVAAPSAQADAIVSIKMLVGQEGPGLSRVAKQILVVGTDIDADEAQRLIDASFAERA